MGSVHFQKCVISLDVTVGTLTFIENLGDDCPFKMFLMEKQLCSLQFVLIFFIHKKREANKIKVHKAGFQAIQTVVGAISRWCRNRICKVEKNSLARNVFIEHQYNANLRLLYSCRRCRYYCRKDNSSRALHKNVCPG